MCDDTLKNLKSNAINEPKLWLTHYINFLFDTLREIYDICCFTTDIILKVVRKKKKMITKEQVMNMILDVCPEFQEQWDKYFYEAYNEDDEQLLYIDLSEFARFVLRMFKINEIELLKKVFELVEVIVCNGDDYVSEAITIGFLEDLQTLALGDKIELCLLETYLGSESKKWWIQILDFWSGKIQYIGHTKQEIIVY